MNLFPSKYHRVLLLSQLRTLGVSSVEVSFSGSGDNGSIDKPECYDADGGCIDLSKGTGATTRLEWPTYHDGYDHATGSWTRTASNMTMTLEDILREITSDALSQAGIDWYNNDGGQGRLSIDFTQSPPQIELEVGVNITHVDEHNFNFSDEWLDEPEQSDAAK